MYYSKVVGGNCWIGLYKSSDTSYSWLDGNPSPYRNWPDGNKPSSGDQCVRIKKIGDFEDKPCNGDNRYVCKGMDFFLKVTFTARQHMSYVERYTSDDRFRLSVCLSQSGIMPKRLKLRSCGLHCRIAHEYSFLVVYYTAKFQREQAAGCRIRCCACE